MLECCCYVCYFSCRVFLVCFCFNLCVCWIGLSVVLVLFFFGLFCLWFKKSESLLLIPVSGSCFLFLFCLHFVSRCSFVFGFLFVLLFCLNHNFLIFLLCFLFSCCSFLVLLLWYFVIFKFWLPIKNISQKIGNSENPQK